MLCLLGAGCLTGVCPAYAEEAPRPANPAKTVMLHFNHPAPVDEADADKKQGSYRVDLSAVALSPDGKTLWTAVDETVETDPGIERLRLQADESFGKHKSWPVTEFFKLPAPDKDEGRVPETDTEGLCLEGGYLWMVGANCLNRKQANRGDEKEDLKRLAKVEGGPNRYVLARIPLAPEAAGGADELKKQHGDLSAAVLFNLEADGLISKLMEDKMLKSFVPNALNDPKGIPSKDNGLDIEGLAVAKGRIFLGLRGPVLRGWALILEVAVEESGTEGVLKLKNLSGGAAYAKHFINLEGCGVRDLCVDGNDLLILAGPTMDLDGPACVYRWKEALTSALASKDTLQEPDAARFKKVLDLPVGIRADHPEGLALLPRKGAEGKKQVMILYDSPAPTRLPGEDDYLADVFDLPND